MNVDTRDMDLLARAMNAALKRHETAAMNIANSSTPGFKARAVKFEEAFREALDKDPRSALTVEPEVFIDEDAPASADGNSVNLERELGLQQKNSTVYGVLNAVLRHKITTMKSAITGQPRG